MTISCNDYHTQTTGTILSNTDRIEGPWGMLIDNSSFGWVWLIVLVLIGYWYVKRLGILETALEREDTAPAIAIIVVTPVIFIMGTMIAFSFIPMLFYSIACWGIFTWLGVIGFFVYSIMIYSALDNIFLDEITVFDKIYLSLISAALLGLPFMGITLYRVD